MSGIQTDGGHMGHRKVLAHRIATAVCVLLAIPAVLWWSDSVLFVILLSLATQAYTSLGSAEAADDRNVTDRLDKLLKRGDGGRPARVLSGASSRSSRHSPTPRRLRRRAPGRAR